MTHMTVPGSNQPISFFSLSLCMSSSQPNSFFPNTHNYTHNQRGFESSVENTLLCSLHEVVVSQSVCTCVLILYLHMHNTFTTRNITTLGTDEIRLLYSPGSQLNPLHK